MKNGNEKLERLLRQFMDESKAREAKDDLSFADRLFADSPVPALGPKALVSIQAKIQRKLRHRRYLRFGKPALAVAAVVAVVLLAGLYTLYSESPTTYPGSFSARAGNTAALWDDALYVVNLNADPIGKELADLTESIHAISKETYEPTDTFSADLLEFEEIESLTENTDFWKG